MANKNKNKNNNNDEILNHPLVKKFISKGYKLTSIYDNFIYLVNKESNQIRIDTNTYDYIKLNPQGYPI